MKFKNLETGDIIEIKKDEVERIERFKGYPDKFEIVEEVKPAKEIKAELNKKNK